jgi:hypothetical protein
MSDLDFTGLRYNFKATAKPILQAFPDLGKLEGLKNIQSPHCGVNQDVLLKYMILMYDPGSPIIDPELMSRKSMCAIEAGMPRAKNGKFTQGAEKLIMLEDEAFLNLVMDFVTTFHSATYSKLVAFTQFYDGILRGMMGGSIDKDKGIKKIEEIDTLERNINDMQARMLRDNTPILVDALYTRIAADRLQLRPENIAEKIKEKEPPVDIKPYGEKYDFKDRYKWKGTKLS